MDEKAKIIEPQIEYETAYRDIKYPRLEYKTGSLLLVVPKNYENEATLMEKHQKWIIGKEDTIKQALQESKEKTLNLERKKEELKELVITIVNNYQKEFDFKVNKIFFRKMKTKWGSYSSKGNLTINSLLKYLPEKLIDYIIYHEMVHSLERKHNERFWSIIEKRFKTHDDQEKDLLVYWFLVQKFNL